MKGYIFFSVHELVLSRVAAQLRDCVDEWSGFVWSTHQTKVIAEQGAFDPMVVFTRDLLPQADDGKPADLAWLEKRETELGVSIQRMIYAERHLLAGRSHGQIMRMVEVAMREIAAAYDRIKPDFVLSEDISCLHSWLHFALARERGIPFWAITSARLPGRIHVYSSGFQNSERLDVLYPEILARGLTDIERRDAQQYLEKFRDKPFRPLGMDVRAKQVSVDRSDVHRFRVAAERYFGDRGDPTMRDPVEVVKQRLRRIVRVRLADWKGVFEKPVAGEKYILYPVQYQPEASTLVQGPMYVDQVALIRDIARSIPVGYRLYVKEHVSNRGRRPIEFYDQLRAIPEVRLLGPDEDTWTLLRGAAAITTVTGTMGWEGLMFDKPVITFGEVFYNRVPTVYRAGKVPKDQWFELYKHATTKYRPDPDAVLALIAAIKQMSYPGRMQNGLTFPIVLEPENIANIATCVRETLGLVPRGQSKRAARITRSTM